MNAKADVSHPRFWTILAIILSAAMLYEGTGLHPNWWITWFAVIPVLLVAPLPAGRVAFAAAFLAWTLGGLNQWHYLHDLLETPVIVCVAALFLPAFFFGLTVLLYRWLLRRGGVWQAPLGFAAAWVSFEYINSSLSPHSTFGSIAYSQMNYPPALQIASITGIWGISFCLFAWPAMAAVRMSGYCSERQKRAVATAAGLMMAIVLGYGYVRLYLPLPSKTVTVGLVASDLKQNLLGEEPDDAMRVLRGYAAQVPGLAAQGAQVVVMPEKVAVVLDSYQDAMDALFRTAAEQNKTGILIGTIHVTPAAKWNEARLYLPDGKVEVYEKHHMLPAYEAHLKAGVERTVFSEPSGLWGVTICKDMDFPKLSREYGRDGIGLLLTPAWDFTADGWLHGRMAVLRGVEDGFSMARAAKQGILTVTDDRGRVLAERRTGEEPFTTLVAQVPVRHDTTFYASFGDWFAWLCMATVVVAVAWRRKA